MNESIFFLANQAAMLLYCFASSCNLIPLLRFILASLGGLSSFLRQLVFYRLDWISCSVEQ
jgi:hypothetical protein